SLALVQAQRLIQKVPITSCPVPIAPPPVGDRPNQRVQRSWLEVLQRQPTGPLTRQLFVQPLQQFPQGRLQELGALLAHVFLQSLEAPTIRRYSKDSAELLHKLGVHGRPHILSRSGALCEVSLFSRQVANPAWTASYPQKTLLYPAAPAAASPAGEQPGKIIPQPQRGQIFLLGLHHDGKVAQRRAGLQKGPGPLRVHVVRVGPGPAPER